jgi:hypothetical protein
MKPVLVPITGVAGDTAEEKAVVMVTAEVADSAAKDRGDINTSYFKNTYLFHHRFSEKNSF